MTAQNAGKYYRRVKKARELAQEFVQLAADVEFEWEQHTGFWHGGKANAAMKRRSLDLTHALAELRKGYID